MDAVSDIKDRLAIEDIVGEYVQLKRAGRNFKGLSPFSSEKTPSLMVSPEKQIWHDFSSGKGGNVFSFVMEMEGLDFRAALEHLARKAGVDLAQYQTGRSYKNAEIKQRLHEALELAAHFYQKNLVHNNSALKYVRNQRGFSKQTILDFRLGYSPAGGKDLQNYLYEKGFTPNELKKAGLVSARGGSSYDMFRGRLMIPLADAQGMVVGFTARQLDNSVDSPKYINTPATILYDKGRQAYGLHLAKESIRKHGYAVVVEGNLDVIASHQAGVKNVVASAGTAMTVWHLKTLKRFTSDIRLCFDSDKAGQAAAERAIELAVSADVNLQMINIESGKDPDELIKIDPNLWQQALDKPQPIVDWLMDRYQTQLDITSSLGKKQFTDVVLKVVRRLNDSVERDHYVQILAQKVQVNVEAIRQKLEQSKTDSPIRLKSKKTENPVQIDQKEQIILAQHLLSIVLRYKTLRPVLSGLPKEAFVEENAVKLYEFLRDNLDADATTPEFVQLQEIGDYVKIIILLSEELYQNTEISELQYQTENLAYRLVNEYIKNKKRLITEQLDTANENQQQILLQQVKDLDDLAKNTTFRTK